MDHDDDLPPDLRWIAAALCEFTHNVPPIRHDPMALRLGLVPGSDEAHVMPGSDEAHVIPVADLIAHAEDDTCPCGPRWEPVKRDDGSVGWVVVHHSLDGRERQE